MHMPPLPPTFECYQINRQACIFQLAFPPILTPHATPRNPPCLRPTGSRADETAAVGQNMLVIRHLRSTAAAVTW